MSPRVVVLRNNDYCFLGVLRGLCRAGARVTPVIWDWPGAGPWFSAESRYFQDPVTIPNPYTDEPRAVTALERLGRHILAEEGDRVMIVPSSDTGLMVILDHWDRLSPFFRLMGDTAFDAARHDCIDKGSCAEILEAGGCSIPQTFACDAPDQIDTIVRQIRLPALYKPAVKDYGMSFYRMHDMRKAVEHPDRLSLGLGLEQVVEHGFRVVVQEKIPCSGITDEIPFYLYADEGSRIRMAATAVKEAVHPAPYGTATVLRLGWHPELLAEAQRVVSALRWRGILMIELMRDQDDGTWKVIEINGRPWLFIDWFRQQGLDFLGYLHDDLSGLLSERPDLVTPDPERLRERPVHVDLAPERRRVAAEEREPLLTMGDLRTRLLTIGGRVSFTYDDPDDPVPGRHRQQWALDGLGTGVAIRNPQTSTARTEEGTA